MNRKAAVAGQFYSGNKENLYKDLELLFIDKSSDGKAVAVISPHAGYVFSGGVAASAISRLDPSKEYENIFIIGSSHTNYFEGASIYSSGNYETPLGEVKVNTELCNRLIKNNKIFNFYPAVHKSEHSIEVQLPFLQYWIKNDFKIIPIIIGSDDLQTPREIANILKPYFNERNAFIISTDFSHYPDYEDATLLDMQTAEAISTGNPDKLLEIITKYKNSPAENLLTNVCGWASVLTLMYMAEDNYVYDLVEYKNSGDSQYGTKDRVVGYWAISVNMKDSEFNLSIEEKAGLLKLARETVETKILYNKDLDISEKMFSQNLNKYCGAFVTIHKNSQLRGCIGRFEPDIPLYEVVKEMALAASFNDYRFDPVDKNELKDIEYEISVLTPMKKINSIDEIEPGKHGIYIKKGDRGGTFLPQVATETGWNVEQLLGYCAREKAGLSYTGWKDSDIYIYEAIIFSESDIINDKENNITKYYEKLENNKVKCTLCPHNCILSESQTGFCKARRNSNGEMINLSFEKAVALHIDPVEKKPLYHFHPGSKTMSVGTAGCNMNCMNCQNSHISQASPDKIEYITASPMQIVQAALQNGCNSISYTYTEPTVFYEYMLETAETAHGYGLKNIMVSNGFINKEPLVELIPYINAANIDLKCFNDSIYKKMTSARLEPVLNTLKTLKENNIWLEITYLVIPEWTDDMEMISDMSEWLVENGFSDVPLHFSRFFPSYRMMDVEATPVQTIEKAAEIARSKGMKYIYLGNVRTETSNTQCVNCGETLIIRDGYRSEIKNFDGNCNKCGHIINGIWDKM